MSLSPAYQSKQNANKIGDESKSEMKMNCQRFSVTETAKQSNPTEISSDILLSTLWAAAPNCA